MSTPKSLSSQTTFAPNEPKQHRPLNHLQEQHNEAFIEMELSPKPKPEFEFQTIPFSPAATIPADDLFYKGKLLPLLLPSRRQMLRHLSSLDLAGTPLSVSHGYHSAPPTDTLNTPCDSCNISPAESCRVSCELNPDDCFFPWSTGKTHINIDDMNTKSNDIYYYHNHHLCRKNIPWLKKLRPALGRKLKASRAYLKSIFNKSTCSDEPSAGANSREIAKTPTIAAIMKGLSEDNGRRSFSSAIKRHSPVKCLSSSSSGGSSTSSSSPVFNKSKGLDELRRNSSASEIEGSIEAAIVHCKRTCEGFDKAPESGVFSFSVTRTDDDGEKRAGGL